MTIATSHTFVLDGDKLRELRFRRGWTRLHLANRSGLSSRTIANAENGKPVFSVTANCLATALEIDPTVLLRGADRSSDLDSSNWASIDCVMRLMKIEFPEILANSRTGTLIGYGVLLIRTKDAMRILKGVISHLGDLFDEIKCEISLKRPAITYVQRRFLEMEAQLRKDLIPLLFVLEALPAVHEVLSDLMQKMGDDVNRVLQFLDLGNRSFDVDPSTGAAKSTSKTGSTEVTERLTRVQRICNRLSYDINIASEVIAANSDELINNIGFLENADEKKEGVWR